MKTGGRKKGTPNKTTQSMREVAARILSDYQESGLMTQDFMALEPKDRMMMAEKLMQYTTPKLQAVAVSENGERHFTIEDKLIELAGENDDE